MLGRGLGALPPGRTLGGRSLGGRGLGARSLGCSSGIPLRSLGRGAVSRGRGLARYIGFILRLSLAEWRRTDIGTVWRGRQLVGDFLFGPRPVFLLAIRRAAFCLPDLVRPLTNPLHSVHSLSAPSRMRLAADRFGRQR